MRVVEEPFVTRERILSILRFDRPSTDSPLRTLRRHGSISPGVTLSLGPLTIDKPSRLRVHSSLNLDAARAWRRDQHDEARVLAAEAADLETSDEARTILTAIRDAGRRLVDDTESETSQLWRRFRDLRVASSWTGLDERAVAAQWIVNPASWLDDADNRVLKSAVETLSERATTARASGTGGLNAGVTSFVGIIEHMDPTVVEIAAPNGDRRIVARRELEREGVANIGQAVTIVQEDLPSGSTITFVAPAGRLYSKQMKRTFDPFDPRPIIELVEEHRASWLKRLLEAQPTVLPVAVIPFQG